MIKRGAVEVIVEGDLLKKLEKSVSTGMPLRVKAGFDPTAPDIHLGHSVLLEQDATISGTRTRSHLFDRRLYRNDRGSDGQVRNQEAPHERRGCRERKHLSVQIYKILDPEKTRIAFNSEWMGKMTSDQVIQLAAKHTVARMLEREDFKKRYESQLPISIHEFLYPLIQGYDSVALKADVELGGTDQKFNLLVGRELQKEYGQEPQCIVMMPLLEGLDG